MKQNEAHWLNQNLRAAWDKIDEMTRTYLIVRACDIVRFGERVAKFIYPQPVISGASVEQVTRLVGVLIAALDQAGAEKKRSKEEARRNRVGDLVRRDVDSLDHERITELLPRKLTGDEIQRVKSACWNELSGCEPAYQMARVIEKFAEFCALLARPENPIKIPSRRYVEKAVRTRQEADMTNEMARVFTELPKYTAYAKLLHETEGRQIVWKGKIQTVQLEALPEGEMAEEAKAIRAAIDLNTLRYLKSRTEIEEEIKQRRERWRTVASNEPSPAQNKGESGQIYPSTHIEPDEPPPAHS